MRGQGKAVTSEENTQQESLEDARTPGLGFGTCLQDVSINSNIQIELCALYTDIYGTRMLTFHPAQENFLHKDVPRFL